MMGNEGRERPFLERLISLIKTRIDWLSIDLTKVLYLYPVLMSLLSLKERSSGSDPRY